MSVGSEGSEEDGLLSELFSYLERDDTAGTTIVTPAISQVVAMQASSTLPDLPGGTWQANQVGTRKSAKSESEGSKRRRDGEKIRELEALAAAKMEQFAALVQRNAELKFKNRILSDAVNVRNYQLQIARTGSHWPAPFPLPPMPAAGSPAASGTTGVDGTQPCQAAASLAEALRKPGGALLLLDPELLPKTDGDSLRSIGRLQLLETWRAHLAELSALLLALEANPEDEAAAVQMRKRMAEAAYLFRHASITAPTTAMAFMQTHLETQAIESPPPGHWQRVLREMELTAEQLADLAAVHGMFTNIMTGILNDRRAIKAQMQEGLQAQAADPRVATLRVPPEGEVLPALERSMRKESAAHLLVRGFVFGRTLSVVQFVRAAVHAYPFFPSATGLAAAAAGVVE